VLDAASAAASTSPAAVEATTAEVKEPVLAQADALALLKKSNCLLCHSIEKKVVGPAYRDVATKYRGQDVEAKLFAKVTTGGKGVWGSTAMPPQMANRDDIKSLIKFVLALPPTSIAKSN
jgi:cytochrome c